MPSSSNLKTQTDNLFERDQFEAFVSTLAGTEIVHQWGNASVGKVGGKIFAIYSIWSTDNTWHVGFKCSNLSFEMLPNLKGISPAKYLARAKWVDVSPDSELSMDEIKAYIVEAHRLIASKLTRLKKSELGLDIPAFAREKAEKL
ncbi:MAG TPA: MmcQ/YjbR family DNA-binding protein [Devosia sp.]|nr:MmcQ/YjbR family DNA-binding protein [Devosia sp.]